VGCDVARKAEVVIPLMGGNFKKLPGYPCATVSLGQIITVSGHVSDVIF
jgi:hypothetical protein